MQAEEIARIIMAELRRQEQDAANDAAPWLHEDAESNLRFVFVDGYVDLMAIAAALLRERTAPEGEAE